MLRARPAFGIAPQTVGGIEGGEQQGLGCPPLRRRQVDLVELLQHRHERVDRARRVHRQRVFDVLAVRIVGRRSPLGRHGVRQAVAARSEGALSIGRGRRALPALVAGVTGVGLQQRDLEFAVPDEVVGRDGGATAGAFRAIEVQEESLEARVVLGRRGQLGQRRPQVRRVDGIQPMLEDEADDGVAERRHRPPRPGGLDRQHRGNPERIEQPPFGEGIALQETGDGARLDGREEASERPLPCRRRSRWEREFHRFEYTAEGGFVLHR